MRNERARSFPEQGKEPVIDRIADLARKHPSRSAAARAWGININTLNSYFKNESRAPAPRENLLQRIADSEGVSLEWLKNGTPKPPKTPKSPEMDGERLEHDALYEMLSFLTIEERQQLTAMLARKGVETILYLLDEDNIKLLKMDRVIKDKVLGMHYPENAKQVDDNDKQGRECGHASGTEIAPESLASGKRKAV
ncbi:TPA: hypothetical protein M4731_001385 [Salmonella enterica]|nr:hypothetical protein [Salmonella enterica]MCH5735396.1 hypothetical protein [Salmonella enterica]MCH5741830.1 hypothetical protein [Salmonella enterica]MCH5746928.1 hypothetical protein [Salmonella enterica]MCH5757110.1 hypothetical protein [Salmonella enterica]